MGMVVMIVPAVVVTGSMVMVVMVSGVAAAAKGAPEKPCTHAGYQHIACTLDERDGACRRTVAEAQRDGEKPHQDDSRDRLSERREKGDQNAAAHVLFVGE